MNDNHVIEYRSLINRNDIQLFKIELFKKGDELFTEFYVETIGKQHESVLVVKGDKSKHFDPLETTVLTILNEKKFFSLKGLQRSIQVRLDNLEKQENEYKNKE